MNRTLASCFVAAGLLAGITANAATGEPAGTLIAPDSLAAHGLAVEWTATFASWYSFQGQDYSEGRPVLQPELSAGLRGFSLGLWGNLDAYHREFNEVDVTLQAERELGPVTCSFGYAYLQYPHRDWDATHELIGEFGTAGPVPASLSIHWDVAAGRGRYWEVALSREAVFHKLSSSLGAKLYFRDHYYDQTGFSALETSIGVKSPWAAFPVQPSLSRLWAWENGDFRGDQAIGSRWLMSLTWSPQ
jgi:hypothetical protein